jgi:hypothetical protein
MDPYSNNDQLKVDELQRRFQMLKGVPSEGLNQSSLESRLQNLKGPLPTESDIVDRFEKLVPQNNSDVDNKEILVVQGIDDYVGDDIDDDFEEFIASTLHHKSITCVDISSHEKEFENFTVDNLTDFEDFVCSSVFSPHDTVTIDVSTTNVKTKKSTLRVPARDMDDVDSLLIQATDEIRLLPQSVGINMLTSGKTSQSHYSSRSTNRQSFGDDEEVNSIIQASFDAARLEAKYRNKSDHE